jgi:uncharacterized protein YjbI with pentapeptide repeats
MGIKKINFDDLSGYVASLGNNDNSISLNEFIQNKYSDSSLIADLSDIKFDKNNKLDLSKANLSFTILDNVDFNGKHVVIKGANLKGCSLAKTRFTGYISLENVDFGPIELDKNLFALCQLTGAKYNPNKGAMISIAPSKTDLDDFLKREDSINLNLFLQQKYNSNKIVADLSNNVIDSKFSNKDISGTILHDATITGEIENLILRDCKTRNTLFKECILSKIDLRGTSLASSFTQRSISSFVSDAKDFDAVMFEGQIEFINPIMSVGFADPEKLENKCLIPLSNNSTFTLKDVRLDPCYNGDKLSNTYHKCTIDDIKAYKEYIDKTPDNEKLKDFVSYMNEKKNLTIEFADLSELDFSSIKSLNRGKFYNCNFALSKFNGMYLESIEFNNCNLSCADFASKEASSWLGFGLLTKEAAVETSLKNISFQNCDLTFTSLSKSKTENLRINNSVAINLQADELVMSHANLSNNDFSGGQFYHAEIKNDKQSDKHVVDGCNFQHSSAKGITIENAELKNGCLESSNWKGATINHTTISHTDFTNANLEQSTLKSCQINASKFDAKLNGATIEGCSFKNTDLNKIDDRVTLKENDFDNALESINKQKAIVSQLEQKITNGKQSLYRKYAIAIAVSAVTVSIFAPVLAPVILPTMVAAVAAPIVMQASLVAGSAIAAAFCVDFAASTIVGNNTFSVVDKISSFLGAEKLFNYLNKELVNEKNNQVNILNEMEASVNNIENNEMTIVKHSKNRAPKKQTHVEKFLEKKEKKQHENVKNTI